MLAAECWVAFLVDQDDEDIEPQLLGVFPHYRDAISYEQRYNHLLMHSDDDRRRLFTRVHLQRIPYYGALSSPIRAYPHQIFSTIHDLTNSQLKYPIDDVIITSLHPQHLGFADSGEQNSSVLTDENDINASDLALRYTSSVVGMRIRHPLQSYDARRVRWFSSSIEALRIAQKNPLLVTYFKMVADTDSHEVKWKVIPDTNEHLFSSVQELYRDTDLYY